MLDVVDLCIQNVADAALIALQLPFLVLEGAQLCVHLG